MIQCDQCDKPAIVSTRGNNLCVDCFYKLQQAIAIMQNYLMAESNFLLDQISAVSGIYMPGRYEIPTPTIQQGSITLNNFNIDNSMIGVVNGATITNLDVSITQIKGAGQNELADEIKKLTEEVIKNGEIEKNNKNEILDQLSYLVEQIKTPTKRRNKTVIKTIFEKLADALSVVSDLITIWNKLSPLLNKFLQI